MTEREKTLRIIRQELVDTRKQDDECQFGIVLGALYLAKSLNIITNSELHRLNKLALNASIQAKLQRHEHGAVILGKRITDFQHTNRLDGLIDGIAPTPDVVATDCLQDAAELLQNMIDSIESKGNYSVESTALFLNQALGLIRSAHQSGGTQQ